MYDVIELTGQLKVHLTSCCGMDETDGLCLEIETVALGAIELVAQDGTAKTLFMGAMHPQLVGATRMRPKS